MPRYFRNAAILAKVETTYGVSAAPTGAANALLISNLNITYQSENVARDLVVPFIGGFEQLVGRTFLEISFSVELASSGAAGTAPPWGALLRACGYAETVTAAKRVEYNPVTPASDSVTISYFMDGIRYNALGARGNAVFKMSLSQRPVIEFRFIGMDEGATAMATPGLTLTAWKKPLVVNAVNSGSVTLGCTYAADPVAISGGTAYASQGLEMDLGNVVNMVPLLGSNADAVDVVNREVTGKLALDLTAAQEVTLTGNFKNVTTQSLGLIHGTAAGGKVLVFMPNVQLLNPSLVDYNGRMLVGYDLRAIPNQSTGNDEFKIVAY